MLSTRKFITAKRLGLAVLSLLLLAGCSGPKEQPSSLLQTNLYGNLDGWEPVKFEASPFSSLIQHTFSQEGGDFDPDSSRDGKWLVFSSLRHSPNPDLYVKQVNGSTVTRLTSDAGSEIEPVFSPAGDKVAYTSNRAGNWDIWVVGIDGSNPTRLTESATHEIHPSWSPEGKQIVYCSFGPRGQWELWVVNVVLPNLKRFIGYGAFPSWCPDPKTPKIAFQLPRYRGSQWFSIWTVDLVDGEAKFPTEIISSPEYACISPCWAPDGSKLAYCSVNHAKYEKMPKTPAPTMANGEDLWVVDIDGRNNERLTPGDSASFSPSWGTDGRVYYCSDRKGIENIWSVKPQAVNFAADKPTDLSRHPQGAVMAN